MLACDSTFYSGYKYIKVYLQHQQHKVESGESIRNVFFMQLNLSWYQFKTDCYNFRIFIIYSHGNQREHVYSIYTKEHKEGMKTYQYKETKYTNGSQ